MMQMEIDMKVIHKQERVMNVVHKKRKSYKIYWTLGFIILMIIIKEAIKWI